MSERGRRANANPLSLRRRAGRLVLDRCVRPLARRAGVYVLTEGYSTPIPELKELERRGHWSGTLGFAGIDMRLADQLSFLTEVVSQFSGEEPFTRRGDNGHDPHAFVLGNGVFDGADAAVLYSYLRNIKPRRVVEVGAGHSTKLIAEALARNERDGSDRANFVSIDPFPPPHLDAARLEGCQRVEAPVQDADLRIFEALGEGDVFFVDSSHVAKAGSDVNWIVSEIIPRLARGVNLHFHDVFLPFEYARAWFGKPYQFWSEQYVLHALLLLNPTFRVEFMAYYLHREHAAQLKKAIPFYQPDCDCPTSFWIQKVA